MFKRILVPHGVQKDDITTQLSDQARNREFFLLVGEAAKLFNSGRTTKDRA